MSKKRSTYYNKHLGRTDSSGRYHPPRYTAPARHSSKLPIDGSSRDLSYATIQSIPKDAIPEYIDTLVDYHSRSTVMSMLLQQIDIYRFSANSAREWYETAMLYLKEGPRG